MAEQEKCPECGKPKAETLEGFFAGTHCGLVQEACRTERRDAELAVARKVIKAAEAMRNSVQYCPGSCSRAGEDEAFDVALAEWRKVKG